MSVENWDPRAGAVLTHRTVVQLLAAAARLEEPRFGLDAAAAGALAPFARHGGSVDWAQEAERLDPADLVALIRLFTRAEAELPGWESGDASPVIPLARELKRRGAYPADLTAWIRAHSDNRFLPYGNLMDRL